MNRPQALRILGLEDGADEGQVRRAFDRQLRQFRDARRAATEPSLQRRLDKALAATVLARRELLGPLRSPQAPAVAPVPRPNAWQRLPLLPSLGVLGAGLLLVLAGLFSGPLVEAPTEETPIALPPREAEVEDPTEVAASSEESARVAESEPEAEAEAEPDPVVAVAEEPVASAAAGTAPDAGAASEPAQAPAVATAGAREPTAEPAVEASTTTDTGPVLERAWLDAARLALARAFRTDEGPVLPRSVDASLLADLALPGGWRFVPQRDGAAALLDDDDAWLLLVPLLEAGRLGWLCLADGEVEGCRRSSSARLADAVRVGAADAATVAAALSASAPELGARLARGAARRLDGRVALANVEQALARGDLGSARALLARAADSFEAAGDLAGQAAALARLARLLALDAEVPPAEAARAMLRCRDLRDDLDAPQPACPGPSDFALALEQRARTDGAAVDDARWERVRWWYEQGVAERDGYSARGLARMYAVGLAGERDRERALALLEEAARDWESFSDASAAASAAQFALLWGEGWGVEPDAGESSWWASQGARLGHVGSALRLAGAFALGSGTARDLDRARDLVAVYREFTPLFEIAFYRNVGQRLTTGVDADVEADPEAGQAWFRRAFQLCNQLAEAGIEEARIELAGMYFSGEGAPKNAARAVEIYAAELETAPVKAGNMLAWIRATHPDAALRDGEQALRLAREVVARAPDPDYQDTLAAALAEGGDFEAAVRVQREALALLDAEGDPGLAGQDLDERRTRLRERLRSYEAGRPWRDS